MGQTEPRRDDTIVRIHRMIEDDEGKTNIQAERPSSPQKVSYLIDA